MKCFSFLNGFVQIRQIIFTVGIWLALFSNAPMPYSLFIRTSNKKTLCFYHNIPLYEGLPRALAVKCRGNDFMRKSVGACFDSCFFHDILVQFLRTLVWAFSTCYSSISSQLCRDVLRPFYASFDSFFLSLGAQRIVYRFSVFGRGQNLVFTSCRDSAPSW